MSTASNRACPPLSVAITFCLLCASLAWSLPTQAGKPLVLGETAPDWVLPNSHGEFVSFYHDSGDRAAVLLFWTSWCPYCAELLPELHKLQREFDGSNVKFYAINIWEDGDPVGYFAKHGYNFTLLLKGDTVAKRYSVSSTPGLVVVGPDKSVRYIRGKNASAEQVCEDVKQVLLSDHAAPNL